MDLIMDKAKEIGLLIREDDRVKRLSLAEVAFSSDFSLQKQIKTFNEARNKMFELMNQGIDDKGVIDPLNTEIRKLYEEIMADAVMKEYNSAKEGFEKLLSEVNDVIYYHATGEESGCNPSKCASCQGGCGGH